MIKEEILRFIDYGAGSGVCVFRQRVKEAQSIVLSIYLAGKKETSVIRFEFDPITMVSDGEGWIWQTVPAGIEQNITFLERFLDKKIEDWENVSKTGLLETFDDDLDLESYKRDEKVFMETLELGKKLVPHDASWYLSPEVD